MSLGQPSDCSTFGEYAGKFVRAVLRYAKDFHRADITFDRYCEISIKNVTRKKRAKGCSPIRRAIEDGSVRRWLSREKCCQVLPGQCRQHSASGEIQVQNSLLCVVTTQMY